MLQFAMKRIPTRWVIAARSCCMPTGASKVGTIPAPTAEQQASSASTGPRLSRDERMLVQQSNTSLLRRSPCYGARMIASVRILVAVLTLVLAGIANAHPHVWVTMHTDLVYAPDGRITGIRHAWSFDDMFSTFATQGLESKEKGKFTREELAPLAKVNVESLKEYDFFTYATADGAKVELTDPAPGYWLDYAD